MNTESNSTNQNKMTKDEFQKQLEIDLSHNIGSEQFYKHLFGNVYTEGVKYVAEKCGAYWLIDAIISHQRRNVVAKEDFQVWILTVNGTKAELECQNGNDFGVFKQYIEFTDFPLDSIKFYFCNNTLMLPSEY